MTSPWRGMARSGQGGIFKEILRGRGVAKRLSWKLLCPTKTDNTAIDTIALPLIRSCIRQSIEVHCSSLFRAYFVRINDTVQQYWYPLPTIQGGFLRTSIGLYQTILKHMLLPYQGCPQYNGHGMDDGSAQQETSRAPCQAAPLLHTRSLSHSRSGT